MRKYILSLLVIAASGGYVWYARVNSDTLDALPPIALAAPGQADTGPVLSLPTHLSVLNGPGAAPPAAATEAPPALPRPVLPPAETVVAEPPKTPAIIAQDPPAAPLALPDPPTAPPAPASGDNAVMVPLPHLRPTRIASANAGATAIAPPDSTTTASVTPPPVTPPPLPTGQYRDGAYAGPTIDAFYGLVQVRAIVQGGKVVSIDVLKYPTDRRTSQRINRYALPLLKREVLTAQSARVDIVSGATLTSMAYRRSLGDALAAART